MQQSEQLLQAGRPFMREPCWRRRRSAAFDPCWTCSSGIPKAAGGSSFSSARAELPMFSPFNRKLRPRRPRCIWTGLGERQQAKTGRIPEQPFIGTLARKLRDGEAFVLPRLTPGDGEIKMADGAVIRYDGRMAGWLGEVETEGYNWLAGEILGDVVLLPLPGSPSTPMIGPLRRRLHRRHRPLAPPRRAAGSQGARPAGRGPRSPAGRRVLVALHGLLVDHRSTDGIGAWPGAAPRYGAGCVTRPEGRPR